MYLSSVRVSFPQRASLQDPSLGRTRRFVWMDLARPRHLADLSGRPGVGVPRTFILRFSYEGVLLLMIEILHDPRQTILPHFLGFLVSEVVQDLYHQPY